MQATQHVYVHFPFCLAKCAYCDFFSIPVADAERSLLDAWLELAWCEMCLWRDAGDLRPESPISTVYFGGGSPSLIDPAELNWFLRTVAQEFIVTPDAEITLEVQPGTADPAKLRAFAGAGVNRFSVGVQSFNPERLRTLGRSHTVEQALAVARSTERATISLDLISGIPGQSLDEWRWELEQAVQLNPSHISAYELTYHAGTRMDRERKAGRLAQLPEGVRIGMFEETRRVLMAAGYEHYEVSNYALPGCRSRHNLVYWELGDFVGLGAGAHSFIFPHRYVNADEVNAYARAIRSRKLFRKASDSQDRDIFLLENLQMAMRLLNGVDLREFGQKFHVDMVGKYGPRLSELAGCGLLVFEGDTIRPTLAGCLRLDSIVEALI